MYGRGWEESFSFPTPHGRLILANYISQTPLPAGFPVGLAGRRWSRKQEGGRKRGRERRRKATVFLPISLSASGGTFS